MKHFLFGFILLFVFPSRADFLDQVDLYLNGTKVWNTSSAYDGTDLFTDTLHAGDTMRFHAYTDWNQLELARLIVHDMYGKKVKEIGRNFSQKYGAEFEWVLTPNDFLQEFKISLDYNIQGHDNWWFATLTNEKLVRKNILMQDLYDAESIWDSVFVKAEWFKHDAQESVKLADIPEDFSVFYDKFLKDSSFQKNHIAFLELIGVVGLCDTTIRLNALNLYFNNWDFRMFFQNENHVDAIDGRANYLFFSEERFYYEFRLKEIGMIYRAGFEKRNGEWKLTLYYENAC